MTHNYIPLHLHTEKSLMDGTATAEEYAKRAHELGMPSLAVTDHGTMSSHREFAKATEALGIKPIFGIEAYVTHDINDRRDRASRTEPLDRIYNHLTIIAKNKTGYKNLSRLNEIAWTDGYFHKPRIDFDLLDRYSDGLIIGSACMGGLLNSAIEVGDFAVAKRHLNTLHDIAGDDFYVELMPHNNTSTDVEGINRMLIELADANNIKTIVTPDCHHAHKGQKVIQEIMLIANVHPKELTEDQVLKQDQDGRGPSYIDLDPQDAVYMNKLDSIYGHDRMMTFNKFDIHLLSGQEMWDGMLNDARQDSFDNTLEIDSKVDHIELPQGLDLLPVNFENPAETINVRCTEFLDNGGYGQEYYDRLAEETSIITDLGFDAYFLIVNDIVQWAAKQGIMTGPGRGSGVGSLVNFALGNTGVDPIEHNLLFFRFIDPSRRGDWPDIDTDFMDRRRGEVKAYVAEKYGNVASIATYQKFRGKGMIKDIARVFRIPLSEVSRVNKLIDTWEEYKESSSVKWFRDKYPQVEIYGDELKGRTRGTGMHASGLVAARVPLAEVAPIETRSTPGGKDRMPVIAVDMEETAEIGLIKLDILGLKALSTISDTLDLIKQRTRKPIDLNKIPMDDHAVYQMLSEGHTSGIFQAEQAPYTKLLIQMGVDNFNDLVATNALIRPGAAKTIGKDYVMRKLGTQRITYVHEDTKSFTKDTYGLFVYQEQIMLLCTELAGMSMVEANKVRKITSKKKDASALAEYRSKFVDGASAKIGEEGASKLWDDILKWSEYGFNKCLSGDTLVRRSGSNGYEPADISIKELFDRFNSDSHVGKKYRGKTGVRIYGMDADGRARYHRVNDVVQNGVKMVYKITTDDGKSIKVTSNHRMWTPNGYMSIDDGLSVGDTLSTCDFVYDSEHRQEPDSRLNGLGKGWSGSANAIRVLASDGRNRPALDGSSHEYDASVALIDKNQCAECGSNNNIEIAHLDSNPRHNSIDNLMALCSSCHKKLDYAFCSRKRRGTKGYAVNESHIETIEPVGEEMTYDVEMDSEEHNFFGNGILVHNSHSVAYSVLTYWMAWLKYYYAVEFMTATLINEGDKNSRTQYLIEAKRMGIKVALPHINKSQSDFTIERDAIRMGLSSVKYISDKIAARYVSAAPFESYAAVEKFTFTKGNGVNSRALASLNAIGALSFSDNPMDRDAVKSNLYEYLNLPEVAVSIPEHWPAFMTTADDFEDQGAHIMIGIVTNVRRGKGWSLITIMDNTGTFGVFDAEDTMVVKGGSYLMLIGSNRIVTAVPLSEIDNEQNEIVKWLNAEDAICAPNELFVLSFSSRKTKAGQNMATMIVSTHDRDIYPVTVFARQYPVARAKLIPGNSYRISCEEGRDGGWIFKSVE